MTTIGVMKGDTRSLDNGSLRNLRVVVFLCTRSCLVFLSSWAACCKVHSAATLGEFLTTSELKLPTPNPQA